MNDKLLLSINSLVLRELRRLTHRKSSVLSVLALVLDTRTEGKGKCDSSGFSM